MADISREAAKILESRVARVAFTPERGKGRTWSTYNTEITNTLFDVVGKCKHLNMLNHLKTCTTQFNKLVKKCFGIIRQKEVLMSGRSQSKETNYRIVSSLFDRLRLYPLDQILRPSKMSRQIERSF